MWVLRSFWKTLVFVGLLIGLIYLPADLYGLPEVYPNIWSTFSLVDRFDVIITFSVLTAVYVSWAEFWPKIEGIIVSRKRSPLSIIPPMKLNSIQIEPIPGKPGMGRFKRVHRIGVRNDGSETLSDVRVSFDHSGLYGRLVLYKDVNKTTSVELNPGETAEFFLGKTDLGEGSARNLFDKDDERYANIVNFRTRTVGARWLFAGTFVREKRRVERNGPEDKQGKFRFKMELVVNARDISPIKLKYLLDLDFVTGKTTISEVQDYEDGLWGMKLDVVDEKFLQPVDRGGGKQALIRK